MSIICEAMVTRKMCTNWFYKNIIGVVVKRTTYFGFPAHFLKYYKTGNKSFAADLAMSQILLFPLRGQDFRHIRKQVMKALRL